jgi:mono/diheme cytochrome c family protein
MNKHENKSKIFVLAIMTACILLVRTASEPSSEDPSTDASNPPTVGLTTASESDLHTGKEIYRAVCATCHGINGNGSGPVAPLLKTKPRDFTKGIFKFRSTPSGQLPTNQDLYFTISMGVHTTAMPSFKMAVAEDRAKVIEYIKTFSARFSDPKEYPLTPIEIGPPVPFTMASIAAGRKVYVDMQCASCHGDGGEGNGPSAKGLTDVWGHPIRTRDLTEPYESKLANNVTNIYRTFTTGLDGTPMPSYADSLSNEQRWDLANYVLSLQHNDLFYDWLMPGK